jgi:hypothetical protein
MINKGQWVILPAKAVLYLPGLHLSPPEVAPQCSCHPRWICDYSWRGVNKDTHPLAAMEAMQLGWSLEQILHEFLFANPAHGLVHMIKLDISDGFYRIGLNIDDIPKLGVVFLTLPGDEPLIAFPLVLTMGWLNSPPIFLIATETIADIANARLSLGWLPPSHPLDDLAASVFFHLTRPTGDPSQCSRLSLTPLATSLFQWLGPLPLMWMSLWMSLWVWLRNTSSKYIVPFWKLSMRSFAPYLLQPHLHNKSPSLL